MIRLGQIILSDCHLTESHVHILLMLTQYTRVQFKFWLLWTKVTEKNN